MSDDLPNQNNNSTPPSFGSNFNPHTNPVPSGTGANPQDPNNPNSPATNSEQLLYN